MADGAGARTEQRVLKSLIYLDVVLAVLAAVPALALGAPALGYLVAAGAWILQRLIAAATRRWTRKIAEPRLRLGAALFEGFARIWLLGIAIIVSGVAGGRADGLTAALVVLALYTVAFAVRVITGPPEARRRSERTIPRADRTTGAPERAAARADRTTGAPGRTARAERMTGPTQGGGAR